MCVAASGTVVSVDAEGGTAAVDFHGNTVAARTGLVKVAVGDRVLVHAGCIIQKVSEKEQEGFDVLDELLQDVGAF